VRSFDKIVHFINFILRVKTAFVSIISIVSTNTVAGVFYDAGNVKY
jgi:hypothetical protein